MRAEPAGRGKYGECRMIKQADKNFSARGGQVLQKRFEVCGK